MNPSIKRLIGALLLVGTLGVSSVMAVRANASEHLYGAIEAPSPSAVRISTHG